MGGIWTYLGSWTAALERIFVKFSSRRIENSAVYTVHQICQFAARLGSKWYLVDKRRTAYMYQSFIHF
jgi:hypothetical protein